MVEFAPYTREEFSEITRACESLRGKINNATYKKYVDAYNKIRNATPGNKAYMKAYLKAYKQTPRYKAYAKEYNKAYYARKKAEAMA
jgi:hypothetical protein